MNVPGVAREGPQDPRAGRDLPVRVTDVRLACPAGLAWLGAHWATGSPPPAVRCAAVVTALGTLVCGIAVLRTRTAPRPERPLGILPLRGCALSCAALLAVLSSAAVRGAERESSATARWAADRAVASVTARVVADARKAVTDAGRTRSGAAGRGPVWLSRVATVRVGARGLETAERVPLLVIGDRAWGTVRAGQTVRFRARLTRTARGEDVVAIAGAVSGPEIRPARGAWAAAERIRSGLRGACRDLPAEPGGLLPSLVLGDTSGVPERLVRDLRASGLSHLTAVSGTNVTIVVASVLWTLSALGVGRRTRILAAGAALWGFVLAARPEPSVLRASTMGGIGLLGLFRGHRASGPPLLATATVVLLWQDPWSCRRPGLELSVAATAGLLLLAPGWTARLATRMPRPCATALAVPAAACTTCAPVLALSGLPASPVAVPANLLAGPAVAPATVLGALAACCAVPFPPLAALVARAGAWATGWIAAVAHAMAAARDVAGTVPVPPVPRPSGTAGTVLLAGAALLAVLTCEPRPGGTSRRGAGGVVASGNRPAVALRSAGPVPGRAGSVPGRAVRRPRADGSRGRRIPFLACVSAVGVWAGSLLPPPWTRGPGGWPGEGWAIVLCDVGQGDALAVRTGSDRAMLIDAGPDPGTVDACLGRLGIRHLDLVIVTHLHADHVAGLPGALRGRDVPDVLTGPVGHPEPAALDLARWARDAGARLSVVAAGRGGTAGREGPASWSVRWQVLSPPGPRTGEGSPPAGGGRAAAHAAGTVAGGDEPDETAVNDASLAVLLRLRGPAGSLSVLDLADLETAGQRRLLALCSASPGTLGAGGCGADVVKVAHHGSAGQLPALYRRIRARIALVSVGEGNPYHHPSAATLEMLGRTGALVLRTDRSSDLAVRATRQGPVEVLPRGR